MDSDPQAIHRIEGKLDEIIKFLRLSSDPSVPPSTFVPDKPAQKGAICPVCTSVISFAPAAHWDTEAGEYKADGFRRHCLCKITNTPRF